MPAFTDAYTLNLIASLTRTREEIKAAIGDLMEEGTDTERQVCAKLHRTVGCITADLKG